MFACVFAPGIESSQYPKLIDFASRFSPLLEETSPDSVTLDLRGSELLNGPFTRFHEFAEGLADRSGMKVKAAVALNPDAAFYAAHGLENSSFIEPGKEREQLRNLPLEIILPELAGVCPERFREIIGTLDIWGIYRFGQLAELPEPGIAERLGPDGVIIRNIAAGKSARTILTKQAEPDFCRSLDMEHPIALAEALLFAFSRLLNELHKDLNGRNLAASGIQIRMRLVDGSAYERQVEFPSPIRDLKTLCRVIDLEISAFPPRAAVSGIYLLLRPGRFQAIQSGLFCPGSPEPEKIELVLARIGKMVGPGKIGSPEILDSHHPDAFRMNHFQPVTGRKGKTGANSKSEHMREKPAMRMLRPPLKASVWTEQNRPTRILAPDSGIRNGIAGNITSAAGPWKSSGDWWSENKWRREDWDLQLDDGTVCRAYRDLQNGLWFVDGIYD